MDHKSTSRIGILTPDILHTKFQFLFYAWLARMESNVGCIVNSIQKPNLRLGKTETHAAFAKRCAADYVKDPGKYFERVETQYTVAELQRFQDRVLDPIVDEFTAILNSGGDPDFSLFWKKRNLDACYNFNTPCSFMKLCFDADDDENDNLITAYYDEKTSKHEELETAH